MPATPVTTNGAEIRRLRQLQGLAICELADQIGISDAALSAIELGVSQGRPSNLRKIAKALGVPVAAIRTDGASAAAA